MDESSFGIEQRPGKTWQIQTGKLGELHPSRRSTNVTVFVASGYGIEPIFMLAESTNKIQMVNFLKLVKRKSVGQLVVVLDNHKAYSSPEVK